MPEPISFDTDTEVLSFINGEVPHDMPKQARRDSSADAEIIGPVPSDI